ncbi:hypothetical protein SLEP1_g15966 [Rubroshorea leprosula]|uniref:DUF1677 family protein n=1 Tax=Rubroshorea leprosula TaxID=152421 RepID=A0AAV5IYJ0_9ROSI|nr:hypothetical protein SLEP1_g15966 [Rubroshorea leprosula]
MAAIVMKEGKKTSVVESQSLATKQKSQTEFEFAECDCCGFKEECTPAYIARVREKYEGRWICGLCAEAVKDETYRSKKDISADEALDRHMKFCEQFRSSSPPINTAEELISAMKHLLRRSLDSPKQKRSSCQPSSASSFIRSKSYFPTI